MDIQSSINQSTVEPFLLLEFFNNIIRQFPEELFDHDVAIGSWLLIPRSTYTGIDWKSLDSRSIEFFLRSSSFARVDIQSSSNHCEAPSNFFLLHSSMMSL